MQFRILGSPELYDEKRQRLLPLTSPKQRLLLGALLAGANSSVPREWLVRELWGALPPRKKANTLNAHVSGLRKALSELEPERTHTPRLVAWASGYILHARATETDSGQFCLAVARARKMAGDDPQGAYDTLRGALGLWRGAALAGGAHGPVSAALVTRLEEERLKSLEILFDCALRTGRHQHIIPELDKVTAAHPLRERFHDQLMLALCRSGRGAEAIGVYTRARQRIGAAGGRTPLLSARLEQISVVSPALFAAGTEIPESWARSEATAPLPTGREIDRPPYEADRPRYEIDGPPYEADRPRHEIDGPLYEADRPRYEEAEQETARSVVGYLAELLSGQALHTGGV
ncbi:BTAD domain-containing putative transcriptional regulator [Streptomyces sp. NPDC001820]|uniref:AfsR/SARP family transcriptional regulator n=1 Tax=Streptomyces sp. NPDC001820 TaxID=3364613 RepID=UPI0036C17421